MSSQPMRLFITIRFLFLIACTGFSFITNAQEASALIVSPEHPISHSDTSLRTKLWQWGWDIATTPNKLFTPHPSAQNFPGVVKAGYKTIDTIFHFIHKKADSSRYVLSKKFIYSAPTRATIYSTGLYAVAGQPVYVQLPSVLLRKEIYLMIGAHSDYLDLSKVKEDLRRMPSVISVYKLDTAFKFGCSPFGGLIYLLMPPNDNDVNADIIFKNVITSPRFQLGSTSVEDWRKILAINKAPWGEIASNKVIITLPDSALQAIRNPKEVLTVWDKILSAESELAQLPSPYIRTVRMVVDEHISAGFMHAGYPIMIHHSPTQHMLSLDVIANPEKLLRPENGGANWGFFHEIGHTLQNEEWIFDGTTEVSCNLFTLYVFDKLLKTRKDAHPAIESASQKKRMLDFFINGASYKLFSEDPFVGLIPFMQLQKRFGWSPFKKVFKWYLNNPSLNKITYKQEHSPEKANIQKIDRFVERISIETKSNLVPFFRTWSFPVGDDVEKRLMKYKSWIPDDLKPFLKKN